jgi:anti-sigma B factor antagonist
MFQELSMHVNSSEIENAVLIKLEGEMMLGQEADEFHEAIRKGIEMHKDKIVIDLANVKFITSWGIGILIHGYTTATKAGRAFNLVSVPEKIKNTFRITKIDTIFQQFDSLGEALTT